MVVSDGGGKVSAGSNPVCGKKDVMAMLLGLHKKFYSKLHMELTHINNQPAIFYYHEEKVTTCQIISINNDKVSRVFLIRNPEKLQLLPKYFLKLSRR